MGYMGQVGVPDAQGILLGMAQHTTSGKRSQEMEIPGKENGLCSRPGCAEAGRYGLHGVRACSRACLEAMLRAIVVSEQAETLAADLSAAPRVQLGRILIEQGSITEAQLDQALRSQRTTGAGKLGSWLKQQVALSEADFAAALSIQWRCPVFRLGNFAPRRMAVFLPQRLAEKHGALALRVTGETPRIAICFEDHIDSVLLRGIEQMHGIPVEGGLLTAGDFWQATRELLGAPFPRCSFVTAPSVDEMARAMSLVLLALEAPDARLVAVGGTYWLRVWRSRGDVSVAAEGPDLAEGRKADASTEALNSVALDVLCTQASPAEGERLEFLGCEYLANRMIAGGG